MVKAGECSLNVSIGIRVLKVPKDKQEIKERLESEETL